MERTTPTTLNAVIPERTAAGGTHPEPTTQRAQLSPQTSEARTMPETFEKSMRPG